MAVDNRLEVLLVISPRATRALRAMNPCPSGLVALDVAESRQSYSRRNGCWQNDIDTARCCDRMIHDAGERSYEYATLTCGGKQQQ